MPDEEIKGVREARRVISAECGHDIDRVVAYYRTIEDELKRSDRFRFAARTETALPRKQDVRLIGQ